LTRSVRQRFKSTHNEKTYPFDQVFQDFDFDKRLGMEPFLVPDNLDCNALARFVITTLQYLTKGTFSEEAHDLIPIGQMVTLDMDVVASLIIIAVIVDRRLGCSLVLLSFLSRIPDRLIVQNFPTFVQGQRLEISLDKSWISNRAIQLSVCLLASSEKCLSKSYHEVTTLCRVPYHRES
jgi:hypothetical protein